MTTNTPLQLVSFPVFNTLWPGQSLDPQFLPGGVGPRVLPFVFDFSANGSNGAPISGDLVKEDLLKDIGNFQSIFIDNSGGAGIFTLNVIAGPNHIISIPAQSQGILPLYVMQAGLRFTATQSAGTYKVPCLFANFPQAYQVWKSQ